jgi:acetyl-CoA carboxylase biotin carboxyl carrier protein
MKGPKNKQASHSSSDLAMPGVDIAQLERLLDFMAAHGLKEFEYEHGGLHIRLKKASSHGSGSKRGASERASSTAPEPAYQVTAPAPEPAPAPVPAAAPPAEELHVIKSPIVGTFYSAPGPEAAPFVKIGDSVQSGQVVCIIEAMKLMNEIEADLGGEVVRVLAENGQPVEYGQGLFAVRPIKTKK